MPRQSPARPCAIPHSAGRLWSTLIRHKGLIIPLPWISSHRHFAIVLLLAAQDLANSCVKGIHPLHRSHSESNPPRPYCPPKGDSTQRFAYGERCRRIVSPVHGFRPRRPAGGSVSWHLVLGPRIPALNAPGHTKVVRITGEPAMEAPAHRSMQKQ